MTPSLRSQEYETTQNRPTFATFEFSDSTGEFPEKYDGCITLPYGITRDEQMERQVQRNCEVTSLEIGRCCLHQLVAELHSARVLGHADDLQDTARAIICCESKKILPVRARQME
jgi:hypothetical protein